eukprot:scaffold1290_cov115-Isochrysis_galbana.AAC.3
MRTAVVLPAPPAACHTAAASLHADCWKISSSMISPTRMLSTSTHEASLQRDRHSALLGRSRAQERRSRGEAWGHPVIPRRARANKITR